MRSAKRPQNTTCTTQSHRGPESSETVPETEVHGLATEALLGLARDLEARYAADELTRADLPLIYAVTRETRSRTRSA